MPTLEITVRWLTPAPLAGYHGEEWPPSPSRLFQALLAAASRPGGCGQRGIAALRRLELRPPPTIEALGAQRLEAVKASVPNNDGDRIVHLLNSGNTASARRQRSKLRTLRQRSGWSVPAEVRYLWSFDAPDTDPDAFATLASGITLFGQGADLAWASATWHAQPPPQRALRWPPTPDGSLSLPVPDPGETARLCALYTARRQRMRGDGVMGVREAPPHLCAYTDPLAPPRHRWQAFRLLTPEGSAPWSVAALDLARLAAMGRHAVQGAATAAGLDEDAITALMGHGGDARIYVLPLPNVGHRYADGRARRLLLAAPPGVSEEHWLAVLHRLTAAELTPAGAHEADALLEPVVDRQADKLLWRFTQAATRWTSVSPVILPGYDRRRGKPRPARTARRLLRHAGIPAELVRSIELSTSPWIAGVGRGRDYFVPHHLAHFPRAYVRIEFHRPVAGPLMLGAGVGAGLGLLGICEDSSDAATTGQRSHPEI